MKRFLSFALAVVMALGLTACSGGAQTTASADFSVQAVLDEMLTKVTIDDPLTLTDVDMLDFFGIKSEHMAEFAAVTCSNGISAQEIVLVKAADKDAAAVVAEKLTNRLNARAAEAENYLPDQYAIITECSVLTNDLYIALIIHPEHDALEELYSGYVKG